MPPVREEADKATEGLAVAEAGIASAEAAITEGQKQLVSAESTLQYHRARLQDTKIVAPFAGLVVRRNREPGDIAVPGSSIFSLISTDEVWISAWIDETEMATTEVRPIGDELFSGLSPTSRSPAVLPGSVAKRIVRRASLSSMCESWNCQQTGRSDKGRKRSSRSNKSRTHCTCRQVW